MLRQSPAQRWSSLVLLAVVASVALYFGVPHLAYRIGRSLEAGRSDAADDRKLLRAQALGEEQIESARRLTAAVRPAVVRVEAIGQTAEAASPAAGPEPAPGLAPSLACGVIIDAQGLVLTNCEPLSGHKTIRVLLPETHPREAQLVGCDPETDLALVRFQPPPDRQLTAAPLRASRLPAQGEFVVALGHAFRQQDWVWLGRVNLPGRAATAAACLPQDFLGTAAANDFNSGGPLLDARGEIVGINVSWSGLDGGRMGFAVPACIAREVVDELRSSGYVRRGWLGVFTHTVHPLPQPELPPGAAPVCIDYVIPESPALAAGLLPGDLLLRVNDWPLRSAGDLRRFVAATRPPVTLRLTLLRDGSLVHVTATVQRRPETPPALPGEREWGIRPLCHLPAEARRLFGLDEDSGVVVERVYAGARAAGLRDGDVIREIDDAPVCNLADFCREVRRWSSFGRPGVKLTVHSPGTGRSTEIHLAASPR
ncbi:MAG: trypsin-like peptidase domain-containing protein [Planctomycetaceae bacterium]